jgi:hypothetical protein
MRPTGAPVNKIFEKSTRSPLLSSRHVVAPHRRATPWRRAGRTPEGQKTATTSMSGGTVSVSVISMVVPPMPQAGASNKIVDVGLSSHTPKPTQQQRFFCGQ